MIGIAIANSLGLNFLRGIFGPYKSRVEADGGVTEAGQCVDAGATPLLQTASLLLIPSGYKGGKLYSEIPTNGNGDFTWTRGSDGFRTNESGLIQRVPWNLVQQSETFENSAWTKRGSTITSNSTTAPNGTLTADELKDDTSSFLHDVWFAPTAYSASTYFTISAFVKANTLSACRLIASQSGGANLAFASFNLSTQATSASIVGNFTNATSKIDSLSNGWFRVSLTFQTGSGGTLLWDSSGGCAIRLEKPYQTQIYTGTGQSLYIWGAQLVEGSSAETYLPTTDRLGFPRLDYSFGSCPGVMIEGQRTNLALYSAQFDDATWTKSSASITANSVTSPDGTTNADTFESTTNLNANVTINQPITIVSGTTYSTSIYVKANTQRFIFINFASSGSIQDFVTAIFDLNDFTLGQTAVGTTSGTLVSTSIQQVSNGFYRITIVASINRTDGRFRLGFAGAKTGNFIGTTGECAVTNTLGQSIYLWGAQMEAGAFATTYIPTTTATATRLVDTCNKTGISSLIGQTEGTFYAEIIASTAQTVIRAIGTIVGANGYTRCRITAGNGLSLETFVGGSFVGQVTAGVVVNGKNKVAFSYKNGEVSSMFLNGTLVGSTPTVTTNPTGSELKIGMDNFNASPPFNLINQVALFTTRLTTAQCQALTTL